MQIAFNQIASSYDETFTNSEIGKRQRNIVWNYLERILPADVQLDILELNCGTGEDALFLANKGYSVTATDVSEEMLDITNAKISKNGLEKNVGTKKINIEELQETLFDRKFDVIFSNFGGMNCVEEEVLGKLSKELKLLLNSKGRIILVLMPKFCLWETVYFMSKLNLNESLRRSKAGHTVAKVGEFEVKTYYHSPSILEKKFANNFVVRKIIPIGFFIPPSYLNNYFAEKKKTLNFLASLETKSSNLSLLSNAADHFLIDMELKE
ncbi:MAG: class I SAM-dependent methyltransferase [Ignavibacterium sp.]|nr:MAG: class I SAM-dependent methyltransferase [Ignavibacterium sp.]